MVTLDTFVSQHPMLRQLPGSGTGEYFSEEMFHQLQPHLPLLIKSRSVHNVTVDPSHVDMFAGDFYGYLKRFQPAVPYEMYWLSCRLSGMNGPNDFDKRHLNLFLVTETDILSKVYTAKKAINRSAF